METIKSKPKRREYQPNFYPFIATLDESLRISSSKKYDLSDFKDLDSSKSKLFWKEDSHITNFFNLESAPNLIYDFTYISLPDLYLFALLSSDIIYIVDLPKKPDSQFQYRESIQIEIKEINQENNQFLEGLFKSTEQEKEFLNCCDFGFIIKSSQSSYANYQNYSSDLVLACGGKSGVISLLIIEEGYPLESLTGHINEVNCLKFAHPNQVFEFENILLSGSKDGSIIIWNILFKIKVAILKPKNNPHSDVIAINWTINCDFIISAHLESIVKIWQVDDSLKKKIGEAKNKKNGFKTLEIINEVFKNNESHKNYNYQIDQIECFGYSIISKDVQGNIVFWIPSFENQSIIIFKSYKSKQTYPNYFNKFCISNEYGFCFSGNDKGEIFIYDLADPKKIKKDSRDYIKKIILDGENNIIRKLIVSDDKNFLFAVSDSKKLYKINLKLEFE